MNDKIILVTGGTGSFGTAVVRKLLEEYMPLRVIIFSNDEQEHHRLRTRVWPPLKWPVTYICADIADYDAVHMACIDVDYVIHASAMKHVGVCEDQPEQAIRTNVIGTLNLKQACLLNEVEKCVVISTDKAVHPVNLYGTAKALADMSVVTKAYSTIFSVIRYGNFWRSRGSVFDIWEELYKRGKVKLPVTSAEATRFFVGVDQAVDFAIKWLRICRGGEIVAPKMGSLKVIDVCCQYFPDCEPEIVGMKPGEKLHEMLVTPEWCHKTRELEDCYITDFLGTWAGEGNPVCEDFCYTSEAACQNM